MISQGSHQQLYLNDVANVIRMQEQVSLQSFIARKKTSTQSEVELTALDLYPKVRKSLQPRLERAMVHRDSIPLLNKKAPRSQPSVLLDEPKKVDKNSSSGDEKKNKGSERLNSDSSSNSFSMSRTNESLLSLEQNLELYNLEKNVNSKYYPFVSMGILAEKRDTSFGLSYNMLWLLRFCIVNVMIACA